jgi:plasmid stabilization system protein ParE
MYNVLVTEPAKEDLKTAVSYIANDLKNSIAANNFIDEANRVFRSLSEMPNRYPIVKDTMLAAQGIRIAQINNYLAFYIVREKTKSVSVLRVLHSRRDWINIL